MGDWEFEHSAESEASPKGVWDRYTEVEQWSEWSAGVDEASLDGQFEDGSSGSLKASSLPRSRFELEDVEEERSFTTMTKMPGAKMRLAHELEPSGDGTRITHRVTMSGPLGSVWSRTVGWIVKRDLPKSVDRLAEVAIEKQKAKARDAEQQKKREERLSEADAKFREEIKKTTGDGDDAGGASLPGSV